MNTDSPRPRVCFETPPPTQISDGPNLFDSSFTPLPAPIVGVVTPLHRRLTTPPRTSRTPPRVSGLTPPRSRVIPTTTPQQQQQQQQQPQQLQQPIQQQQQYTNQLSERIELREETQKFKRSGYEGSKKRLRKLNHQILCSMAPKGNFDAEELAVASRLSGDCSSLFGAVFENPRRLRKMEPYLSVTPDQQDSALRKLRPTQERVQHELTEEDLVPEKLFNRIKPRFRPLLTRTQSIHFVQELEQQIFSHIESDEWPLALSLDPFHRLLAHGICEYYGLHSQSRDETTERIIEIRAVSGFLSPAKIIPLSSYLESLSSE